MTNARRNKIVILFAVFCLALAGFFATLFSPSLFASAEVSLAGTGTKEDPYLIENKEDFILFASGVNEGKDYRGEFVKQTKDIDFEGTLVSPVGSYDEGNYFYGTYNGDGTKMINLNINEGSEGYAALFGTLGGTVCNLGIESGNVKGYCAGSFAVNAASGTAKIINCYSKANITSTLRGGGIVDNYAGILYNCVSMATNNGEYADLCSYNGRIIENSYTLGKNVNAVENREGKIISSSSVDEPTLVSDETTLALNGYIYTVAQTLGDIAFFRDYNFWFNDGGVLTLLHGKYDYSKTSTSSFEGEGTILNPYLIENRDDFVYLANVVNEGNDFNGMVFRQTQDIDFKYLPMHSIASLSSGRTFNGIFDGGGYTLNNYCVDSENYNSGLFGLLGGKVVNLGMENGYIIGSCIGAIAVNSAFGSTTIFNSYSKATMIGARGGALVDNFSGSLIGCVGDATFNGKPAPLVAYLIRDVEYCYSTGSIIDTRNYSVFKSNKILSKSQLYTADISADLNSQANYLSVDYGMYRLELTAKWSLDGTGGFDGFLSTGTLRPKDYLSGNGSRGNPYLIQSVEDFIFFHNSVNLGTAYNGRFVKQTVDLDFDGKSLNPIGLYDSGNYFYGTYDGAGHTIANLDIRQEHGRAMTALFGTLAGFLYNLGYVSGTVYGEISAGLVNTGITAEGAIVNCYSTVNISAYRGSGISDSYRGRIINCWSDGKNLLDDTILPLNAIVATQIVHCFSTGEINGMGYESSLVDSGIVEKSYLADERFAVIMNAGCLYSARKNICTLQSLSSWVIEDGSVRHGDFFKKSYSSYISAFRGLGTKISPYKIYSAEDLKLLQLTTAAGEEYKNQYFVQMNDIDCTSFTCAIPVGELPSQVFYAEYDGQGYVISRLVLSSSVYDQSCSFIRTLGGTVKNLYLKACTFQGKTAAGIACYTDYYADTKIVNCIVTNSIIYGEDFSSGLVCYGRETRLYNCLYISYDARSSQYVCLQADKMFGCYTNVAFHDENYLYVDMTDCDTIDGRTLTLGNVVALMNSNIIALKTLLNENIVGEYARFAMDGSENIRFNGFFRITPFNLGECMKVLGLDISLYMFLVLGILVIVGSMGLEVYLSGRKKIVRISRPVYETADGGTVNEYGEKVLKKRQIAVHKAENRMLGRKERAQIEDNASRISVVSLKNSSLEERRRKRVQESEKNDKEIRLKHMKPKSSDGQEKRGRARGKKNTESGIKPVERGTKTNFINPYGNEDKKQ